MNDRIAILGGVRTPFVKAGGVFRTLTTEELGAVVVRESLARTGLRPDDVDTLIAGNVGQPAGAQNVARVIGLLGGLPTRVPAVTVHRNCASGLEAVAQAADLIRLGRARVVVAVGVESMSSYPIHMNDAATAWFAAMARAKSFGAKLATLARWRPGFLAPKPAILAGLKDPVSGLGMGEAADRVAREWNIGRAACDAWAAESHRRAAAARARRADEIVPVATPSGLIRDDDGIRADSTPEALARLAPRFDRVHGLSTAGNSSQISDGACALVLVSKEFLAERGLSPAGYLENTAVAALEPERFALGPLFAIDALHRGVPIPWETYDRIEINEAFASQMLACIAASGDAAFARTRFGREAALGTIPADRLNPDGGAIALGHPVGASGARLVLGALRALERDGGHRALVALCVGGGLGMAAVVGRGDSGR